MPQWNFDVVTAEPCLDNRGGYYGFAFVHVPGGDMQAAEPMPLGKNVPDFENIPFLFSRVIHNRPYRVGQLAAVSVVKLCARKDHIGLTPRSDEPIRAERVANLIIPKPDGKEITLRPPQLVEEEGVIDVDLNIPGTGLIENVFSLPATKSERHNIPVTRLVETLASAGNNSTSWIALRGVERVITAADLAI